MLSRTTSDDSDDEEITVAELRAQLREQRAEVDRIRRQYTGTAGNREGGRFEPRERCNTECTVVASGQRSLDIPSRPGPGARNPSRDVAVLGRGVLVAA